MRLPVTHAIDNFIARVQNIGAFEHPLTKSCINFLFTKKKEKTFWQRWHENGEGSIAFSHYNKFSIP